MNNKYKSFLIFAAAAFFSLFTFLQFSNYKTGEVKFERIRSSSSPKAGIEMKKGRWEYFFNMLRDPATNQIPKGIRTKELEFAEILSEENKSLNKITNTNLAWSEAGPTDVGGRTRALAVDITNPNVIIAGGASGGIWKSTDNGGSWVLKSSTSTILSVTSIAQDPRAGFTNTWYYATGEFMGSGDDLGFTHKFTGDGIYKSTNNGETWAVLPSTLSSNIAQWDSEFDFVLNIKVSPTTGSIFVASNGDGILRSTDGGNSFTNVLGGTSNHMFSDISVASNGNLVAVLSRPFQGVTPTNQPGVYKSTNDGANWTGIALSSYPSTASRSSISFAPSNPDVAYLLTYTGGNVNNREEIKFYKINVVAGTSIDRSGNLPDFSAMGGVAQSNGFLTTQGGYDIVVAVKPDNENFVLIAGTCLFRSADGFSTQPTDNKTAWIGGYHPVNFGYPNLHPDIHSYSFDPTNPNKMWWGHDGGLSYTTDITNNSYQTYFPWENKNNGYNVTQFYHISIRNNASDSRIMGGTQDNGSPYFTFNGAIISSSEDVSSGDGSFSYFGQNFAYTSSQNGNVRRIRYDQQGNPSSNNGWSIITPTGASNQLFINPFTVDPNNEEVMYYLAGNVIWRNNQLSSIPDFQNGTTVGWTKLDNLAVPSGYIISTLKVSNTPASILYYGASSFQDAPKIYKLTNSTTATSGAVEISIPGAQSGAYVHDIAINPDDGNEIIVALSNYNITGLYHSTNGGQSYTAIEGNLEGNQQNPGPSLRSASILPGTYFVGTSIGLFSTSQLNGNSTTWTQEGSSQMGNVIVNYVTSRKSDGRVVAGTHGRGAFVGTAGGGGSAILNVNVSQLHFEVQPGLTRTKEIIVSNPGGADLSYNVTASFNGEMLNKNISTPSISIKEVLNGFQKKKRGLLPKGIDNQFPILSSTKSNAMVDELILDDGNALPDGFFGPALTGYHFYWANEFLLDRDFALEKVRFYMRTESSNSNSVRIEVWASNGNPLFDTTITTDLSSTGKWYEFDFPQHVLSDLTFQNGGSFYLIIVSENTALTFPAGYDYNGLKPGHSYWAYYEVASGYFSGYAALSGSNVWLIRAVGNSGGGGNQPPVATAQVSPNPAGVNATVNFNGSGSYDPDGTIAQYAWVFGDGATSNQMNATHSYSQAGQYNYSLTVTDNLGATGQTAGQITISDEPSRWTINPSSGTVSPGGSQNVSLTFSALNLPEGNYTGQISITSNGGNTNIPVTIFVSNTVDVNENESNIYSYKLEQNYPNPFNPSTTIRWSLAEGSNVELKIFNLHGEEIATLLDEYRNAGNYETVFDAGKNGQKSLASGVYFYTLKTDNYNESKKLILLK